MTFNIEYDNRVMIAMYELTTVCIFAEILCDVFWDSGLCLPNKYILNIEKSCLMNSLEHKHKNRSKYV